jgi:signal peptidase I
VRTLPHVVEPGGAACAHPILKEEAGVDFVKQIVAGPGDEIYIRAGHVYRKAAGQSSFTATREPYIKACGSSQECNFPTPITIPQGDWFLLGDNRGESDDSRFWGPVPTAWIAGIVSGVA